MADEYRRLKIASRAAAELEQLLAEAFERGAEGAEELPEGRDADSGASVPAFSAWVYAPSASIEALREALLAEARPTDEIGASEVLPDVDWSEAWKEGLEALVVSERLVVRPPFVEAALQAGQREVVIEPGQAFGTGGHASTHLCLQWVDALYAEAGAPARLDRVLDVGTGSGVLAMAAIVLGAGSSVGFDLDPVAIEAAVQSAADNGLSSATEWLAGPIQEAAPGRTFPLVLANLLKREVLPMASEVAARVEPEGLLVLAGLLEEDGPEVLARFAEEGLQEVRPRRTLTDGTGRWISPCLGRVAASA